MYSFPLKNNVRILGTSSGNKRVPFCILLVRAPRVLKGRNGARGARNSLDACTFQCVSLPRAKYQNAHGRVSALKRIANMSSSNRGSNLPFFTERRPWTAASVLDTLTESTLNLRPQERSAHLSSGGRS
jgi:hypothetical protein